MNISDEDLVTKCIEGEKWARDIFYEKFFKLVIFKVNKIKEKYTYNFTKDDIEDCIQEIWKSFWEKNCHKLYRWKIRREEKCKLANWVAVCTGNVAIIFFNSVIRKRKNLSENEPYDNILGPSIIQEQDPEDPESILIKKEKIEKVMELIENLPNRERFFVALRYEEELSYNEISKIMGIAKVNLFLINYKIIKKLRKLIVDSARH